MSYSKYNSHKTEIDGIIFDSKAESNRYAQLKLLEYSGEITDLCLQVKYSVDINGKHICNYFADFEYKDKSGALITEDVKGKKTAVYSLKKKLVEATFGIKITEIK